MLKKLTLLLVVLLMLTSVSHAQWTNQGAWPKATVTGQAHGMAIDPDGKIWASDWAAITKYGRAPGDTIRWAKAVRVIYVFNPDGTQTSFSPIWIITDGNTIKDTLWDTTTRGMRANTDGNILIATGAPALYKVDYKTGKAIKKTTLGGSPTAPCVSSNGTIFIAPVVQGAFPLSMYDQNLVLIGTAIKSAPGFSRSFEVSSDGNTIYWSGYTTGRIYVYNRQDEFSSFSLKDSILIGVHSESLTWNPKTKYLWVAGGSYNDLPTNGFTPGTWYAYNFATNKVVDSLKMKFDTPKNANERPRSLAFSADGKTAYIGIFGEGGHALIQKLVQSGTDIKKIEGIPTSFDLSQNYPNPFNPTTTIKFSMPKEGMVSLKVYNILGQEVATLLDTYKGAGIYQFTFDASKLSSGVYTYTLSTEKLSISKKMLLVK